MSVAKKYRINGFKAAKLPKDNKQKFDRRKELLNKVKKKYALKSTLPIQKIGSKEDKLEIKKLRRQLSKAMARTNFLEKRIREAKKDLKEANALQKNLYLKIKAVEFEKNEKIKQLQTIITNQNKQVEKSNQESNWLKEHGLTENGKVRQFINSLIRQNEFMAQLF